MEINNKIDWKKLVGILNKPMETKEEFLEIMSTLSKNEVEALLVLYRAEQVLGMQGVRESCSQLVHKSEEHQ